MVGGARTTHQTLSSQPRTAATASAPACDAAHFNYYLAAGYIRGASYYGHATGTTATFNAQQPPLDCSGGGSLSAAWVALVNKLNGWLAQVGWVENYGSYTRGVYEYSTPSNGSYVQVYINGGEEGIGFKYSVTFDPSTGVYTFYQDGQVVGKSGDPGWTPYYNYVATEVHYPDDYNAGDPGNHFVFSHITIDGGNNWGNLYPYIQTEAMGQYQNVYYPSTTNSIQVWDSRNWGANP